MTPSPNYFGLSPEHSGSDAKVVILPVPYEATVSYGHGTARGPEAILHASQQVELYDEELGGEPHEKVGIATAKPLSVVGSDREVMARIEKAIGDIASKGKLPIVLGGEHSITPAAVRGAARGKRDITVVQFDAHADLRQEYEGTPLSHACAMARVRENFPCVQIGIRNLSTPEAQWVVRDNLPVFFAKDIVRDPAWMEKALTAITTDKVYVTIDVDAFDCALMPCTGTPEPGGLSWYDVTGFLEKLTQRKKVIGFDLVELAPQEGHHAPDFLVAKLLYKCIGYWSRALTAPCT